MLRFLFLLLTTFPLALFAAPPQAVTSTYEVTRNGQPFATVNESFRQTGNRYRIESITKGLGAYALFGARKLVSEGEVTPEGLRPARFETQQGDKKPTVALFDWAARTLTMTGKRQTTADLEPGTQDLASYAYQFMFHPPEGESLNLPVTTGKKLNLYQYRLVAENEALESMSGVSITRHLASTPKNEGDDSKELWLAPDRHFLPAKIAFRDESGARVEQVLTRISVE